MCLEAPALPIPELGLGLTIAPPTLPGFSGNVDLCCKQLPFNIPAKPLPLPPGTMSVAGTLITTALAAVNEYLDSLPPKCPLE
jgi:hypothetical protein